MNGRRFGSRAGGPRLQAWALGVALGVWLLGSACPEEASPPSGDLRAPCKELGQRCEFSPGKLGSCVVVDNCRGPSCFVCQSQH